MLLLICHKKRMKTRQFGFLLRQCNCYLSGYRQLQKYFLQACKNVRQIPKFRLENLHLKNLDHLRSINKVKSFSVHFRRSDFSTPKNDCYLVETQFISFKITGFNYD